MSFFDGIDTSKTDFESGGYKLIPKDTRVLATCEGAENGSYEGNRYIKLSWRVNRPDEFANTVIFQKLKVYDLAKGQAHKAMLAAIAQNAGGRLFDLMRQRAEHEPSDASLQAALTNSTMVLLVDVWELDDKSKSGNWVKAVSPMKGAAAPAPKPPVGPPVQHESDIPF